MERRGEHKKGREGAGTVGSHFVECFVYVPNELARSQKSQTLGLHTTFSSALVTTAGKTLAASLAFRASL